MRLARKALVGWALVAVAGCGSYRGAADGEPVPASDSSANSVETAAAKSDISPDEQVVFYHTSAYLDASGEQWTVPLHGIIYEPEANSFLRKLLVEEISEELSLPAGSPEANTLRLRLGLFLVDNERRETIAVRIGDQIFPAGTSQPNGHFQSTVQMDREEVEERLEEASSGDADRLTFTAVTPSSDSRRFAGEVQFVGRRGLSVISDIDDTIKLSEVGNYRAMLANTFLKPFQPVPGMPELYQRCQRNGAVFHYVSGSPWQLYLPLAEFAAKEGYPFGSFDLKYFRVKELSTLRGMLQSQREAKLPPIRRLLGAYPERRFVLFGDSGEEDPEIYSEAARLHPGQVVGIFIRNVSEAQLDDPRFQEVIEESGVEVFRLFEAPEEIEELVEELVEEYGGEPLASSF